MYVVKRSIHNPILEPNRNHPWEAFATFNLCPIKQGRTYHGVYRAISNPDKMSAPEQLSIVCVADSKDGIHFTNNRPLITPTELWEKFGCEDPRVTSFEGKNYIFYTALSQFPFNADGIKVAVAVTPDFKKITERHLVTPFNAKAMTLFPERINGKVTVILSAHTDSPPAKIAIAQANTIEELWSADFWENWHNHIDENIIDTRRNEYEHIEVGAPPIKTKHGWLLVYSHIQNYFPSPENFKRVFGIEAVLLDLNDPRKIVGRTKGPLLVPEESYEKMGYVPDIVFPSGAIVEKDVLHIYYGAADTSACYAKVNLTDLICTMALETNSDWKLKRFIGNPIITPDQSHPWEAQAVFNPAAILLGGVIHLLYRAMSMDNTSTIGYASSKDGLNIIERLPDPVYVPRAEFESKKISNNNSGCEDPRLIKIKDRIYMCYTAFDGVGPARVAVTSIKEEDFLAKRWVWSSPELITPRGVDDKDTCLFPEKIKGKYFVFHRIGSNICGDDLDSLDFSQEKINKCIMVFGPREGMWDSGKVGIATPPIKTKYGWLLLYHASSHNHHTYRVGAVLLDLNDPTIVLARSTDPIFEPEMDYEKEGIVPNVVFPCGMVEYKELLYVYYGGGDKVVGVATMELNVLLNALTKGAKL